MAVGLFLAAVSMVVTGVGSAAAQRPDQGTRASSAGAAATVGRSGHEVGRSQPAQPTSAASPQLSAAASLAAARDLIFVGPPPTPLETGSPPRRATGAPSSPTATGPLALERISYPWKTELPGWRIEFTTSSGTLRGRTIADEQHIVIYLHTDDVDTVARIVAHELGHAVDVTKNNTGERRSWEAQRGIGDSVPWWPTVGVADFATGAGDFAECFATWQVGSVSRSTAGRCSSADLALLAALATG